MRLLNVVIPSRHFDASKAFYRDLLGLEVGQEGPTYCFLKAGTANIAIHPVDTDSEFMPTGRGMYLDLVVADLEAVRRRVQAESVVIEKEWRDANGSFLLIADPDGNLLEIAEPRAEDSS